MQYRFAVNFGTLSRLIQIAQLHLTLNATSLFCPENLSKCGTTRADAWQFAIQPPTPNYAKTGQFGRFSGNKIIGASLQEGNLCHEEKKKCKSHLMYYMSKKQLPILYIGTYYIKCVKNYFLHRQYFLGKHQKHFFIFKY